MADICVRRLPTGRRMIERKIGPELGDWYGQAGKQILVTGKYKSLLAGLLI